jgi:Predicted membrane protein
MSELIVFAFPDEKGASEMDEAIHRLKKEELITLDDAAVVVRNHDGKVKVKQAVNLVGTGTVGGAFWGMLIGLLFWMPWLGMAIGAITGAITGKLSDYGIDDDFIHEVAQTIEPGGSALFLLISRWTEDKVLDELEKFHPKVVRTSLSKEEESKLKAAFGAGE